MADELRNSRFRYVDSDDVENATVDFGDLAVRNAADDKLGDVKGFIVDAVSGRPYYVVVSSGGWFSGGQYLVPINHSRLEHDARQNEDVLRVNLDKDTIKKYPKFDKDEFARLPDDELNRFEQRIGLACCPDEAVSGTTAWSYESWEHYREPDWWASSNRVKSAQTSPPLASEVRPAAATTPPRPASSRARTQPLTERIVAQDSQPVGNRAEPGNVLGIESGGEETHLGDTPEDERRRRTVSDREARNAEKNNRG